MNTMPLTAATVPWLSNVPFWNSRLPLRASNRPRFCSLLNVLAAVPVPTTAPPALIVVRAKTSLLPPFSVSVPETESVPAAWIRVWTVKLSSAAIETV